MFGGRKLLSRNTQANLGKSPSKNFAPAGAESIGMEMIDLETESIGREAASILCFAYSIIPNIEIKIKHGTIFEPESSIPRGNRNKITGQLRKSAPN